MRQAELEKQRVISEAQYNDARARTAVLYKLTKVMLRLGSFDNELTDFMYRVHSGYKVDAKSINYLTPTGEDAGKVIQLGLTNATLPNHSGYDDGRWVTYTEEKRLELLKVAVLNAGMAHVRISLYSKS